MKGWQSGWFYITEPRDANWAATPVFRSGVPMRLTSWQEKRVAWGSAEELTGLQTCVQNMISKKIKLDNMVQVMLLRRILPCQRRVCNLWEFDSAEHQTLRELFGTMHKDIWKVLFKANDVPPPITKDHRLCVKRQTHPLSFYILQDVPFTSTSSGGI